jgi:hypothetical protein
MKKIVLVVVLAASLPTGSQAFWGNYEKGYEQGVVETVRKIQEGTEDSRRKMLSVLSRRLLPYSIVAVFVVFFGSAILEGAREFLSEMFDLAPGEQAFAALLVYAVASVGTVIWVFQKEASLIRTPAIVLIAATTYPFFAEILPGIEGGGMAMRRSGTVKLKSLVFVLLAAIFASRLATGTLRLPT